MAQRYEETSEVIKHSYGQKKRRYSTIYYPKIENRTTDIYIISKKLDRLDLLAYTYYDDARLWWILQKVNNLPGGTLLIPPGYRIRIPYPLNDYDVQLLLENAQFV